MTPKSIQCPGTNPAIGTTVLASHFSSGAPTTVVGPQVLNSSGSSIWASGGLTSTSRTVAIPEPSSFLILGLVACGGMAYRWKQIN